MVQLVGVLLTGSSAGIAVGGIALTTAAGALTLAGAAVNIGAGLLLSSVMAPEVETPRPQNVQITTRSEVAPRLMHVGLVKVGGNVVFHRARAGKSHRVIVHGHGLVDDVTGYWLDGRPVTLDAQGDVTESRYIYNGSSRVRIKTHRGMVPETSHDMVNAEFTEWTNAHRLDGLFSSEIRCRQVPPERFRRMYPNGEPELSVRARGLRFRDPRTGLVGWSENAAVIIAGYCAHPDGLNRADLFDDADLSIEADLCDVPQALAAGGNEPAWRLSGSFALTERPQDVLSRMLAACAGTMRLRPSGKVALRVGAWREPEFVIRWEDLAELVEVEFGRDRLERYNVLPGRYVSRNAGFREVDATPVEDADRIAADGERMLGPAKSYLMSPSHRQTRRAMRIDMMRDNPETTLQLILKPTALAAVFEDVVQVDVPRLNLTGIYAVDAWEVQTEAGLLRAVAVTLKRIRPGPFDVVAGEDDAEQVETDPGLGVGIPAPANVIVAPQGRKTAKNVFVAGIGVAWDDPGDDALEPRVEVREAGTGRWEWWPVSPGATNLVVVPLRDGVAYDVRVCFVSPDGEQGDMVTVSSVVAEAITGLPAAPTNLSVTNLGQGEARVRVRSSASDGNWKTQILRGGTVIAEVTTGPSEVIVYTDDPGPGTYNYKARAVNVAGRESSTDAGPVSVTVTS